MSSAVESKSTSASSSSASSRGDYHAPEWAKHVVWYQIFPERFYNGDPSNDPIRERVGGDTELPEGWEISKWTGDWYERAGWEHEMGPEFRDAVFFRRYGGDLQGIIDKLDYLQELGINAIYLNPIFDAVSLHKYDTSYYHHVDRFFGPDPEGDRAIIEQEDPEDPSTWQWTSADKLFLELVEKVHERGMRIIIDAVFNHTGTDFWAFRDVKERQQDSPYSDWYNVISFSNGRVNGHQDHKGHNNDNGKATAFDYHSWWGFKDLPELKEVDGTLVEPVRTHIKHITRRWMDPHGNGDLSKGVDGWRLDVPNEIGKPFWEEWCSFVRSINPEAYITGEIWDEAADEYISADLFDAVMNYQFAEAVQDFMIDRRISADDFAWRLAMVRDSFPEEANYVVQNLMDSHDTPRLASMILNPGREYNKEGKPEEGFNVRKPKDHERRIQKLIALFQFSYIGVPMVYYGTEAGMWGAGDPDDRKPMVWPDMEFEPEVTHPQGKKRPADKNYFDEDLFGWYRHLVTIRLENEALRTGSYIQLEAREDEDLFCFARLISPEDYAIVFINRSEDKQVVTINKEHFGTDIRFEEGDRLVDLITGNEFELNDDGTLTLEVEPVCGLVLLPAHLQ